jgi:hypothetical protein
MYGGFVHPIVLLSRASSVITMACTPWLAIIMKSDHACMLLYASSLDWHFFMVYRSKQKKRAPSQWTISITSWLIRKLCYNLLWSRTVPACINHGGTTCLTITWLMRHHALEKSWLMVTFWCTKYYMENSPGRRRWCSTPSDRK